MIPLSVPVIGEPEKEMLRACLDSGYVSSIGPMVEQFEAAFAKLTGSRHAIATASGTAAIHATLAALEIGQGDSVAVSDLTFVASMNPVLYCGARPELIDITSDSWCMNPAVLNGLCREPASRGRRLKAVIPVHLYGCACDMPQIMQIAGEHGLMVVEDATEALGTILQGKQVGTFGHAGCFSFNGNKMLTTGSGGMVVTDSDKLAARIRYLTTQARDNPARYVHGTVGFNYRMDGLSAAMGLAQLKRYQQVLDAKRAIARRYREAFTDIRGLMLHPSETGVDGCFWLYSIVLEHAELRDKWVAHMNSEGIAARPFFAPLHQQPYVHSRLWTTTSKGIRRAAAGISDRVSAGGINLPSSASLTPEDQAKVIACVRSLVS